MSLVIPIDQVSAWFDFTCELEGATYGFEFRWNDRISTWRLNLLDGDGNLLAAGVPVVTNAPLLRAFRTLPGLPAGEIIVVDSQGLDTDAGFEDLGRRHQAIYILSTELDGSAFA